MFTIWTKYVLFKQNTYFFKHVYILIIKYPSVTKRAKTYQFVPISYSKVLICRSHFVQIIPKRTHVYWNLLSQVTFYLKVPICFQKFNFFTDFYHYLGSPPRIKSTHVNKNVMQCSHVHNSFHFMTIFVKWAPRPNQYISCFFRVLCIECRVSPPGNHATRWTGDLWSPGYC